MTPLNTITEEEKKEFEARFCNERICKCCLNKECNHSTTGCPWYQNDVFLHTDNAIQIKAFLTTAMQRAYEAGQSEERAKIREEVEKDRLPVDGEMVDEARLVRKSFNAGLDAVLAKLTPDKTDETI